MLVCFLLGLAAAHAEEFDGELQNEARFLYFNTSSTATSLTLLGAVILIGVIGYLVYAGGLLATNSYNRNTLTITVNKPNIGLPMTDTTTTDSTSSNGSP